MVRKSSLLLGLALGLVWWFGLSRSPSATILWFDAVAAVLAFGIGALIDDSVDRPSYALAPALMGLGLGAVGLFGLARGQPAWAAWINFFFAVAFIGVAIAGAAASRRQLWTTSFRHT